MEDIHLKSGPPSPPTCTSTCTWRQQRVPSCHGPSHQAVEDIHLEGGSVLGTSEHGECDVMGVVKRLGEHVLLICS